MDSLSPRGRWALAGLVVLGLAVRIVLAFTTYGNKPDLRNFMAVQHALTDGHPLGLYSQVNPGNYSG